jgi:inhibitor of KinA
MARMTLSPLGDNAVVLEFGQEIDEAVTMRVRALAAALEQHPPEGVTDVVPAFTTVTVFYDLTRIGGYDQLCAELRTRAGRAVSRPPFELGKLVEIPVCYGGDFGPDLATVAERAGLSPDEAAALHQRGEYRVHAIGFLPGFPYLGGLPARLRAPRRTSPRLQVPAGSVAIGGVQAGIYPLASPGGWNLIGRTPLSLFRPGENPPTLLRVGDRVKFRALSPEEFAAWK